MTKIACIQMNSGENWKTNMRDAISLASQAAQLGAKLIALPENVLAMLENADDIGKLPITEMMTTYLQALHDLTKEYGCAIMGGTLPFPIAKEKTFHNRAYLMTDNGHVFYDKIHLCDITLPSGQSLNESRRYKSGNLMTVADTPAGKLGLTICYDLRFPQLFRALAKKGAEIITVPSAFTQVTGEAHWHTLLKARAIENGCYIIAPAQTGKHPGSRETYGHALIVDPWGTVLADAGESTGVVYADIDLAHLKNVRRKIPSLEHDRVFGD